MIFDLATTVSGQTVTQHNERKAFNDFLIQGHATAWRRDGVDTTGSNRMKLTRLDIKPICLALITAGVLSACGGGGGGDSVAPSTGTGSTDTGGTGTGGTGTGGTGTGGTGTGGTGTGGTGTGGTGTGGTGTGGTGTGGTGTGGTGTGGTGTDGATSTTMSCPEGAGVQCSGSTVLARENGIILTNSGVQTYGVSTNDLANPIVVKTSASGLALPTSDVANGVAEARVSKNPTTGEVASRALILRNFGLTWDSVKDRPVILETFSPTAGTTRLDAAGRIVFGALPSPSDLSYYDFGTKGALGTQENYANNRYFPRSAPSRCAPEVPPANCATTEIVRPPSLSTGDWRGGGVRPDSTSFVRVHEDGDVHAGNGPNDANGNPTILEGGNGIGVPFPGSKGYRSFDNFGFQYTNLGAWLTQDTVWIEEWAKRGNEHNKNRRGLIAYGEVTNPGVVPTTGTATYSGFTYGYYAANRTVDPSVFRGNATVTVNFATRAVTITVQNAITDDSAGAAVPVNFTTVTTMGAAGSNLTNFLSGAVSSGALSGQLGGRYFGPLAGNAPIEIGGTFQMSNAGTGQTVIGGFMGRKQ
jgi:hypothetical protein